MNNDREELFSTKPILNAVLALVTPTVISQLITVVYNMADTFYVGQINNPNQVAATTIAMPIFMVLTAIANLFGLGGASLISRSLGQGNKDKAKRVSVFCIWIGLLFSIIYGSLVLSFKSWLFPLIGANSDTWDYCYKYVLWTTTIGALPTVMNSLLAHLSRSEGYSKEASIGVALGGILNMILDPIFIFTFKMEIEGAAIATMLSNLISMLYFIIFFYKKRKSTNISANLRLFSLKNKIPFEVIMVGFPSFMMTMLASFSNTSLNKIVASYSNEAIAGMGIAKKIDSLAFAIAQGMTQGSLPLIGYNYASGNKERMGKAIKTTLFLSLLVSFLGLIFLYTCALPVSKSFIKDPATVSYGQTFLKILCLACPTTALNFMIITIFQATGKKLKPFILSLLRKGSLDVLFMSLLNKKNGINGVAWAIPLSDIIALFIAFFLFIPYFKNILVKENDKMESKEI